MTEGAGGRERGNEGGDGELCVSAGINNGANHSYGAAGRVTDVNRAAFSKHSQEQREREGGGLGTSSSKQGGINLRPGCGWVLKQPPHFSPPLSFVCEMTSRQFCPPVKTKGVNAAQPGSPSRRRAYLTAFHWNHLFGSDGRQ